MARVSSTPNPSPSGIKAIERITPRRRDRPRLESALQHHAFRGFRGIQSPSYFFPYKGRGAGGGIRAITRIQPRPYNLRGQRFSHPRARVAKNSKPFPKHRRARWRWCQSHRARPTSSRTGTRYSLSPSTLNPQPSTLNDKSLEPGSPLQVLPY